MQRRSVLWACMLMAAMPASAQTNSRMTTGVQMAEPVQPGVRGLERLTPAERLELLRIAEAERRRSNRGMAKDCGPKQAAKPMSDLERASWRLKCGK